MDQMRQMVWKGIKKEVFEGIHTFSGVEGVVSLGKTEGSSSLVVYA